MKGTLMAVGYVGLGNTRSVLAAGGNLTVRDLKCNLVASVVRHGAATVQTMTALANSTTAKSAVMTATAPPWSRLRFRITRLSSPRSW